jgi:hypothetical protein
MDQSPEAQTADSLHQQIMNLPCKYEAAWQKPAPSDWIEGYVNGHRDTRHAAAELVSAALAAVPLQPVAQKFWLWKNFVDGRPEYWAFDNPYPVNLDNADPQTLGEPCGYAIFKPSRQGRTDVSEEQVLGAIARTRPPGESAGSAPAEPATAPAMVMLSEEEIDREFMRWNLPTDSATALAFHRLPHDSQFRSAFTDGLKRGIEIAAKNGAAVKGHPMNSHPRTDGAGTRQWQKRHRCNFYGWGEWQTCTEENAKALRGLHSWETQCVTTFSAEAFAASPPPPAATAGESEQGLWLADLFSLIQKWHGTRDGTPSKAEAWIALWNHAHNLGPHWRARAYVAASAPQAQGAAAQAPTEQPEQPNTLNVHVAVNDGAGTDGSEGPMGAAGVQEDQRG